MIFFSFLTKNVKLRLHRKKTFVYLVEISIVNHCSLAVMFTGKFSKNKWKIYWNIVIFH